MTAAGFALLLEKGLMFGNLFPVTSKALIERYNRALKQRTGKQTRLTEFHIDLSGYSPEIGDELGDELYLNQNGCNREFILLSLDQRRAPLLNAKFSLSRGILKRFIAENEAELFALTARDAVCGELANSVFELTTADRLFEIRRITVEADTTGNHVAEAAKLTGLIERFRSETDAWWDDRLIAEMIELARQTGDVTRNPLALKPLAVDVDNFWTSFFGGLYIFRGVKSPGALSIGPKDKLGALPVPQVIGLDERNLLARFLDDNELVEPIVQARGIDAAAILGQKMDFILVEAATMLGLDLGQATRQDLRNIARKVGSALPDEFRALGDLKRWAESGGTWPHIASDHPAYFYTLRARDIPDRDLVNQLLAELSPLDVRQLFICHKELFYALYAKWEPQKQAYVARFLARGIPRRQGRHPRGPVRPFRPADGRGAGAARRRSPSPWEKARRDQMLIDLVGPWGAVRRK